MKTLTLEITNDNALVTIQGLVNRKAIKIISQQDEMNSPALPGMPLSLHAFEQWIATAEAAPTISLKAAKSEWASRKKRLQHLGK